MISRNCSMRKRPMKVMVFSDSNNLANIFTDIKKALNSYGGNISGEQYVAVQVCNLDTRCLKAHKYEVVDTGSHRLVTLTEHIERKWPVAAKVLAQPKGP